MQLPFQPFPPDAGGTEKHYTMLRKRVSCFPVIWLYTTAEGLVCRNVLPLIKLLHYGGRKEKRFLAESGGGERLRCGFGICMLNGSVCLL